MSSKTKPGKCKFCGKPFEPVTKWQEYCQKKCRVAANNRKMTNLLRRAKKAEDEFESVQGLNLDHNNG